MKKVTKSMVIFLVITIVCSYIWGYTPITTDWPTSDGQTVGKVETVAQKIWATVVLIVQILAVAAVVFAGLRYMFASADTRADIKKQLGLLVLGAILVFSTTVVIDFIVRATNEALD